MLLVLIWETVWPVLTFKGLLNRDREPQDLCPVLNCTPLTAEVICLHSTKSLHKLESALHSDHGFVFEYKQNKS